jgi:hypothetical protein
VSLEIEFLRVVYKEIIEGFSYNAAHNLQIKHLNELENAEQARIKFELLDKYKLEGLLSEKERIKQLLEIGAWTEQQEEEIVNLQYLISDNEKVVANILIPQQKYSIQKIIDNSKVKLNELLLEKKMIIGSTAEEFASREAMYTFISMVIHKDKKRLFENLDNLEIDEIDRYSKIIEDSYKKFTEDNLKKIAVLPFFLNSFSYCKDAPYHFLNKPVSEWTSFQQALISFGSQNLGILSQSEGNPPALIGDTKISDVVLWFDTNISISVGKSKVK